MFSNRILIRQLIIHLRIDRYKKYKEIQIILLVLFNGKSALQ